MTENEPKTPPNPGSSETCRRLAQVVNLNAVRLTKGVFEFLAIQAGENVQEIGVEMNVGGMRSPDAATTLRIAEGFALLLKSNLDPQRVIAKVDCTFMLDYEVRDPELFEALQVADMQEFAASTGLYNVWPFLREYCHNLSYRMGIPTIVLHTLSPKAALAGWRTTPAVDVDARDDQRTTKR